MRAKNLKILSVILGIVFASQGAFCGPTVRAISEKEDMENTSSEKDGTTELPFSDYETVYEKALEEAYCKSDDQEAQIKNLNHVCNRILSDNVCTGFVKKAECTDSHIENFLETSVDTNSNLIGMRKSGKLTHNNCRGCENQLFCITKGARKAIGERRFDDTCWSILVWPSSYGIGYCTHITAFYLKDEIDYTKSLAEIGECFKDNLVKDSKGFCFHQLNVYENICSAVPMAWTRLYPSAWDEIDSQDKLTDVWTYMPTDENYWKTLIKKHGKRWTDNDFKDFRVAFELVSVYKEEYYKMLEDAIGDGSIETDSYFDSPLLKAFAKEIFYRSDPELFKRRVLAYTEFKNWQKKRAVEKFFDEQGYLKHPELVTKWPRESWTKFFDEQGNLVSVEFENWSEESIKQFFVSGEIECWEFTKNYSKVD